MRWRDAIKDPPKVPGHYFVIHPRYGKVVWGWNNGWGHDNERGIPKPLQWIDEESE